MGKEAAQLHLVSPRESHGIISALEFLVSLLGPGLRELLEYSRPINY
jgi:hypothetical protein